MPIKIDLPEFQKEMKAQTDMVAPLAQMTVWRYSTGQFPDAVYWLMLRPELLDALAKDARKLPKDVREKMAAQVFTKKPRGGKPKAK